jgi:hypothetical protein
MTAYGGIGCIHDLEQRKMDLRFGMWNARSRLYRAGSLMTVAKETSKYKLHLVEVQEVKCAIESDINGGTYE